MKKNVHLKINIDDSAKDDERVLLSNRSHREKIFRRAQNQIIQERLSNNIASLSHLNQKLFNSKGRNSHHSQKRSNHQLTRVKSLDQFSLQASRARILNQIVGKLQQKNSLEKSEKPQKRRRSSKLDCMMKGIKKCNRESGKVIQVIKKTKNFDPNQTSFQTIEHKKLDTLMKQLEKVKKNLQNVQRKSDDLARCLNNQSFQYQRQNGSTLNHGHERNRRTYSRQFNYVKPVMTDNQRKRYSGSIEPRTLHTCGKHPCFSSVYYY